MLKAVKVLNRISVILFVIVLLTSYAYMPISVHMSIEEIGDLHKQTFFYYAVGSFLVINILVKIILHFGIKKLEEDLQAWITSLIFIFNIYQIFIIIYLAVWNNQGHIDPAYFSAFTLIGPVLLVVWIFGIFFIKNKSPRTT
ncbi:MAG: hypothetical protein AB8B73_12465 [Ekhidna sp.]